ncbi:hypothetical protein SCLCIDRAFT_26421 [Scleroderma citrinum Foug A]|uniref:Uncharacterized protein n=1 Tax=Scleroderma citrinum Foug A TaxID=1036808 RepID=A0A0C2ZGC4_9AGAM|nr:hypothetical protein SCLCIDRAFT_26421 [Scleroderma citrinum Foug A]
MPKHSNMAVGEGNPTSILRARNQDAALVEHEVQALLAIACEFGFIRPEQQGEQGGKAGKGKEYGAPRPPTPPPCYARHDPVCIEQEINRRPDVIAEGRVAADLDPGLKHDGPISTGGTWSQYVQRVAEEAFPQIRFGCTALGTRDLHPREFYGGTVEETVIPAYRCEPQDSPLPNIHMMPLFPVNPNIHWLYHGTYLLPSAKLHCYTTPTARANFIGFDAPSLTYEDYTLATVPAFWIDPSPEVYQPKSGWRHPWYDEVRFSGVIPTLRDWLDWLDYNTRQIWKHGSAREQIAVPACMDSLGCCFEESRAEWLTQAVLIRLNLADYVQGEFYPLCPSLAWPGSVSRLNDIVRVNECHMAGRDLTGMASDVLFEDDKSASMSLSD